MTTKKDLKRVVRARMSKTGESYTSARAHVIGAKTVASTVATTSAKAEPELIDVSMAGHPDARIAERTGRTWHAWVSELDAFGGAARTHTELAAHVVSLGVDGWWAQAVTVGYERIRGLRAVGQQRGGAFEVSKSLTLPVPIATLYAACAQKRRRGAWLPGIALRVRTSIAERSLRITWPDGTDVEMNLAAKSDTKSTLVVVHRKLASAEAATEAKIAWAERLAALRALLTR